MGDKRLKNILLCIAIFIALAIVVFPDFSNGKKEKSKATDISEYTATATAEVQYELALESRLESLISSVDGAGKCKVMVTVEKGEYKIFAKDSYEEPNGNKYEYVILSGKSGEDTGLVMNVISPEIKGVAVVCEGGDSAVVHSEIVDLVSSVLSISSTRISVTKMK